MSVLYFISDDYYFLQAFKHIKWSSNARFMHSIGDANDFSLFEFLHDVNEKDIVFISFETSRQAREALRRLLSKHCMVVLYINVPMEKLYVKNKKIILTSKKNSVENISSLYFKINLLKGLKNTNISQREREICELDSKGMSVKLISKIMNISNKTVYALLNNASNKTNFLRKNRLIFRKYISLFY